jgi:proteasome lid subunit RPN8/RPN11
MIGKPPQDPVELRPRSKPRVTVSLRSSVWQKLRDHSGETSDGRETAGFLFGPHVRSWKSVSVGWVTRMVTDRNEDTCNLDMHALVAEKASLRASGVTDIDEQGSWHTHPSMDGRPSDVDLSNWLSALHFLGRSFYVGLILTADPG